MRETWREWSEAAWHYAADLTILPKQRDRDLANFLAQRSPLTWESYKWRPSIHMPRAASRITLEITEVRVERLRDISEHDAMAEGVYGWVRDERCETARDGFRVLWESLHGAGSWDANPLVWVVGFKKAGGKE